VVADPWGVPAAVYRLPLLPYDLELPPHLDRPQLCAVGSWAWRAHQLNVQHASRARGAAEAHRRLDRRLAHADAGVVRCSSCGEWRVVGRPCEVLGCRSPWPAP